MALFKNMRMRNVFTWNFIITACAQQGRGEEALKLLERMQHEGILPDKVTSVMILSACASQSSLVEGKRMHARIVDSGFEVDVIVGTALFHMYGKCGSLIDAQRVFYKLPERNVVSWTAMICLYAEDGLDNEALRLFYQMQQDGIIPDKITFVSTLSAFGSQSALTEGKLLHSNVCNNGFELDVVVGTTLVNMYGKCGSVEDAWIIFEKMPERNLVSWNAMMAVYNQHGYSKQALDLFQWMQTEGFVPDKVTFVSILDACASQTAIYEGNRMHACIVVSGFEVENVVMNALVNMYGKQGSLADAQKLFNKMPKRDLVVWTAMIALFAQHGRGKEALELFDQMKGAGVMPDKVTLVCVLAACASEAAMFEGMQIHSHIVECGFESEVVVGTALISMYGNCGSLQIAQKIFDDMPERDSISWNAMIAMFSENGQGSQALQLLSQMQHGGIMPNKFTFVSVLAAYASQAALMEGRWMHAFLLDHGFEPDIEVGNALLNMYGKCGVPMDAWRTFEKMPERNLFSWNAMLTVYAQHGHGKKALQLFDDMLGGGLLPDKATFVSILTACSHAGLLNEGGHYFASMNIHYGLSPCVDHYDCMVDLIARTGKLDMAEELINIMPFQPTVVSFMALLGGCKYQTDVQQGESAVKYMFELEPENPAPYVILSNLYAALGREDDAAKLMSMMI